MSQFADSRDDRRISLPAAGVGYGAASQYLSMMCVFHFGVAQPPNQSGQQCGTPWKLGDVDVLLQRMRAVTHRTEAIERGNTVSRRQVPV